MDPLKISIDDMKKASEKDKVLYNRAVKLGFVVDSSQIDTKLSPVLSKINDQIKKLSTDLDKEHPLFSKSKLGHTINALGGITKGLLGNQTALDSAYKSLDKLGLGWVSTTSNMIQWALAAKNSKEVSNDLYNSMGLLGKGIVNTVGLLGKVMFGENLSFDKNTRKKVDNKLDRLEQERNLELDNNDSILKDKSQHLDAINKLYKQYGKDRLDIIKGTVEIERKLSNTNSKEKPKEESAASFIKELEDSDKAIKNNTKSVSEFLKSLEDSTNITGDSFNNVNNKVSKLSKALSRFKIILHKDKVDVVAPDSEKKLEGNIKATEKLYKSIKIFGQNSKEASELVKNNMTELTKSGGLVGKVFGNLGNKFPMLGNAITKFGGISTTVMAKFAAMTTVATVGISLLIGAFVAVGVGLYKVMQMALAGREEMVKFDKVLGGIGEQGLFNLRQELNGISLELGHLGKTTEYLNEIVLGYMQSGISLARSLSSSLIETTAQVAEITGQSVESIGSFFSSLIKKINLSDSALRDMSATFIQHNKIAGHLKGVVISFETFKEAITSSGNALLAAQAKGSSFTSRMIKDLASLSGFATTLGLNVGELNSKFEEAGSLIGNMHSGFRSLLVVSGGANINQMLDNTFDKTESMLKMSSYIQGLNQQLGGNINLTAQIVSQFGGISKEMAMQLGRMTTEEKRRIDEIRKFRLELQNDEVAESYKNITRTLAATWDKVKAAFLNMFQVAVTKSGGVTSFISKLTGAVDKIKDALTGPTAKTFTEGLGRILDKLSGPFNGMLDNILKFIDELGDPGKSMWSTLFGFAKDIFSGLIDILKNTAIEMGSLIAEGVMAGLEGAGGILSSMLGVSPDDIERNKRSNRAYDVGSKFTSLTQNLEKSGLTGDELTLVKKVMDIQKQADTDAYSSLSYQLGIKSKKDYLAEFTTFTEGAIKSLTKLAEKKGIAGGQNMTPGDKASIQLKESENKKSILAISHLDKIINKNTDIIKGYVDQGLKPTDISFGQTFKDGKWEGEAKFMTIAERQFYLQEEMAAKEKEKQKIDLSINENTAKTANFLEAIYKKQVEEPKKEQQKVETSSPNKPSIGHQIIRQRA